MSAPARPAAVAAACVVALAAAALIVYLWAAPRVAESDEPTAGEAERAVERAMGAPATSSSRATFLDDLERDAARVGAAEAGSNGFVALSWVEGDDLAVAATDVLEAYRARGAVSLETSGYLDLFGNAWGALLRGDDDWVDIVTVMVEGEEDESRVRVVRIPATYEEGP